MNILFITSLYPITQDMENREYTYALHNLAKIWKQKANIVVICPIYIYLSELIQLKLKKLNKSLRKKTLYMDNVPIIVYPIFKIPRIAYFYSPIYRFLDGYLQSINFKPDIIITHYDKSLKIGSHYGRRKSIPYIAGLHLEHHLMAHNYKEFSKECEIILDQAAAIACRSSYIYNSLIHWFPRYANKSFLAPSGIEEGYIQDHETVIQKLNQWKNSGYISILTVGRLIERKKIDIILRALAPLKNQFNWNYTIIGEGNLRYHLEELSSQLGIEKQVTFKGILPRHQVLQEMKESHIFILVSHLETFGLVYLEAMATGNIVIAAKGEGIDGIIKNNKNGFLVPVGDIDSLKLLLQKILYTDSKSQLQNILFNCHHTIKQYTENAVAQNYLEQMERVLNNQKEK